MCPRSLFPIVLLMALAPCRGQDPARWLADLGDPARGEAAEIALIGMGARAAPRLIDVLQEQNDDTSARRARQCAALRVLALLGPEAAQAGATLAKMAVDKELMPHWWHTLATLQPWAQVSPVVPIRTWKRTSDRNDSNEVGAGPWRYYGRSIPVDLPMSSLLDRLEANCMFEREAVADLLGRSGGRTEAAALCRMLRARDVVPADPEEKQRHDVVVPLEDGFRFAASEAVLRLAPDDPCAAIAWSGRALLHPHRSVRCAALASLARFAPDIDDTVPDLLAIARGHDVGLALEAVKVLGMARSGGAAGIAELERLAARADRDVAVPAWALVARLHAAGITTKVRVPAGAPASLIDAVAALGSGGNDAAMAAAWNKVVGAGEAALPLLLERLHVEQNDTPDVVIAAIARVGRTQTEEQRSVLRKRLHARFGQSWTIMLASSRLDSSWESVRDVWAYGELMLGSASDLGTLAKALQSGNPAIRLAAARRFAEPAWATSLASSPETCDLLLDAARDDEAGGHLLFRGCGPERNIDLNRAIHAAAAAALVAFDLPADQRAEFLPLLRPGDDVEAIARGLRRWASARSLPALVDALGDQRSTVAIAAAEAIASLGKDGAPAAEALRKLAASDRTEVAVAARAALKAVGE
jgi:hypothetical protein